MELRVNAGFLASPACAAAINVNIAPTTHIYR